MTGKTTLRIVAISLIGLFILSTGWIVYVKDYSKLSITLPLFIFFMMSIRRIKKPPSKQNFINRLTFFWYICVFFTLILVIRFFNIQVINNEKYMRRANNQAKKISEIVGNRGKIYDNQKRVLAYDEYQYDFIINPRIIIRNQKAIEALSYMHNSKEYPKLLINPSEQVIKKLSEAKRGGGYKVIAKDVSQESRDKILKYLLESKIYVGSAIELRQKTKRTYNDNSLEDLIGLVRQNNSSNGKRIGISGVEKEYENYLMGRTVKRKNFFTNAREMTIPTSADHLEVSANGRNIHLTIDSFLQYILTEEVKKQYDNTNSEEAIGIIMDPTNGKILAATSFSRDENILRSPIIQNQYEPGSTFKPIVISAALEEKNITTRDIFDVGDGKIRKYNHTIRESSRHTRGKLTLSEVLEKSSNVGMTLIGDKMESPVLEYYLREFGFGSPTGVDLPSESSPFLATSRRWDGLKKYTMAFGQGIATTPLQLVSAFSAVVNNGKLYEPYIVEKITDDNGVVIRRNLPLLKNEVISPKVSSEVRKMLGNVVAKGAKRARVEGFDVGGKTGTAQISAPGGYIKNEYLTSFIGFFPLDEPKYVILTMFSKPKVGRYEQYGGVVAAPVFSKVANRIINYKNLTPDEISVLEQQVYKVKTREYHNLVEMPNLYGKSVREAMRILTDLDIKISVMGEGVIKTQLPKANSPLKDIKEIKLHLE